eukprot:9937367-Alexandrium_andersonii.AAC.1
MHDEMYVVHMRRKQIRKTSTTKRQHCAHEARSRVLTWCSEVTAKVHTMSVMMKWCTEVNVMARVHVMSEATEQGSAAQLMSHRAEAVMRDRGTQGQGGETVRAQTSHGQDLVCKDRVVLRTRM